MTKTPIWQWSAVETAAAIRKGEVTSKEVIRAHIDHMHKVNPALNAVVVDLGDDALRAAEAADVALAKSKGQGNASDRCTACQSRSRSTSTSRARPIRTASRPSRTISRPGDSPGDGQSQESRRDRHRPDQHARILAARLHRQPAARADAQPVGSGDHLRRVLGWRRRVDRRRHRRHRPRQRHRRLAALAGALQRRRHHQADAGPHPRLQSERHRRTAADGTVHVVARTDGARGRRRSPWSRGDGPRDLAIPGGCRRR